MTDGKLLKFKLTPESYFEVEFYNGCYVGDLVMGDDGYYAWWPSEPPSGRHGFIEQGVLKELYDKLYELNKEWDEIVQNDPAISESKNIHKVSSM